MTHAGSRPARSIHPGPGGVSSRMRESKGCLSFGHLKEGPGEKWPAFTAGDGSLFNARKGR
jgi:hypothetical protein